MRSFVVAMLIFAFLIAGGVAFNFCLDETSEKLTEGCETIREQVEKENFANAYKKAEELSEYIDRQKPLMSSILDHGNIDEIEREISELLGYTENGDTVNSIVSLKELEHMFKHLPENYALTLQNIL